MNQPANNPVRTFVVLAAVVIGSFLLLVSVTFPEGNRTFSAIQNFGHFLLFVCLALVCLWIVSGLTRGEATKAVVLTGVGLAVFGLGVELFQTGLAGRNASISDFVLDVLGILVGFLVFFSVRFFRQGRTRYVICAGVLACILTAVALRPLVPLIGFDLMRPELPVVRSFDHRFAEQKIASLGGASFKRVPNQVSTSCCGLRVTFSVARYSGVIFEEDASARKGNWSDFETLNIKVFNSLPNTRQISLRINDRLHNNLYADRYNSPLSILPGLNEIAVPLERIATMGSAGTSSRLMDIDDVTHIQIFASEIEKPFTLDVLSIELK